MIQNTKSPSKSMQQVIQPHVAVFPVLHPGNTRLSAFIFCVYPALYSLIHKIVAAITQFVRSNYKFHIFFHDRAIFKLQVFRIL